MRADRASWLAWAQANRVHPGIIALAQGHERILDDVPPRTWTYASDILAALTPDERQAIETTFFGGLTHAEAAARLNQPLGTIKTRIRSGLHKLRQTLAAEAGKP